MNTMCRVNILSFEIQNIHDIEFFPRLNLHLPPDWTYMFFRRDFCYRISDNGVRIYNPALSIGQHAGETSSILSIKRPSI